MSPLRERILCDPLFGIECFGCPNDHAQQDAKTNEYTEWPPRLHVFILSGVRVSIPGSQQEPARQVRRRIELTKSTHSNFANEMPRESIRFFTVDTFRACAILLTNS